MLKMLKNVAPISKLTQPFISILSNVSNFHPVEVVDRVNETQLQLGENYN